MTHDRATPSGWSYVRTLDALALVYLVPGWAEARGELLTQPTQPLSTSQRHRLLHHPSRALPVASLHERVPLDAQELLRHQLAPWPSWAPPPEPTPLAPWRSDPRHHGRLHPAHQDDLEVLFLCSPGHIELAWVRLHGVDAHAWAYRGLLLSPLTCPEGPTPGQEVLVRSAQGAPAPLRLSPLSRRLWMDWRGACERCGFDLLLDPLDALLPPELLRPGAPTPKLLTTACPLCRGPMIMLAQAR